MENNPWSNEQFTEEFKVAFDHLHSSLKSLFSTKFPNLDADACLPEYDGSQSQMDFKDPESGQTGNVKAILLIDIPMSDFMTFKEKDSGKVDRANFIARVNSMYLNTIVANMRESLEKLDNKKNFRIFVQYASNENESFKAYIISDGVQVESGVIDHYLPEQMDKFQFESGVIDLMRSKADVHTVPWKEKVYRLPNVHPIIFDPIPSQEDIKNALQPIISDKFMEALDLVGKGLEKEMIGIYKKFRPIVEADVRSEERNGAENIIIGDYTSNSLKLIPVVYWDPENEIDYSAYEAKIGVILYNGQVIIANVSMTVPHRMDNQTKSVEMYFAIHKIEGAFRCVKMVRNQPDQVLCFNPTVAELEEGKTVDDIWAQHGLQKKVVSIYRSGDSLFMGPLDIAKLQSFVLTYYDYKEKPETVLPKEDEEKAKVGLRAAWAQDDIKTLANHLSGAAIIIAGEVRREGGEFPVTILSENRNPKVYTTTEQVGLLELSGIVPESKGHTMLKNAIALLTNESALVKSIACKFDTSRRIPSVKLIAELCQD